MCVSTGSEGHVRLAEHEWKMRREGGEDWEDVVASEFRLRRCQTVSPGSGRYIMVYIISQFTSFIQSRK